MQREAQHVGHFGDEPVAGRETARDGRLGRGGPTRGQLSALRGTRRGHHDVGSRPLQVRHAGPSGRRGRIRLGLLRVPSSHSRFSQIRYEKITPKWNEKKNKNKKNNSPKKNRKPFGTPENERKTKQTGGPKCPIERTGSVLMDRACVIVFPSRPSFFSDIVSRDPGSLLPWRFFRYKYSAGITKSRPHNSPFLFFQFLFRYWFFFEIKKGGKTL